MYNVACKWGGNTAKKTKFTAGKYPNTMDKLDRHLTNDPNAADRKKDHIELAFLSQTAQGTDSRFYYEPLMAAHPQHLNPILFLGKMMRAPIWISSMTGGTQLAGQINHNLAKACHEFGLGMGLGSCRMLLDSDTYFEDFNLRPIIGDDLPFYANLGIAQIEQLLKEKAQDKAEALVAKLQADGLFIHVNPLQEWLQPEGDRLTQPPIETIQAFLETTKLKVIVKEVGQGMGPASLKALLKLPLAAIDMAAHGGTNFSKLELLRSDETQQQLYADLAIQGHSATEMTLMVNQLLDELGNDIRCEQLIISGGVQGFLDGYYLMRKVKLNAVYGQGSAMLKRAQGDYTVLQAYIQQQIEGLKLANAYLRVR